MNRHIGLRLSALSLSLAAAFAAVADEPVANSLTIYSSAQAGAIPAEMYRNGGQQGYAVPGYAVVRHERDIELKAGRNDLRFTDVAGLIDPTTVSFESLTDPNGTRVVEQNFQFDLVSTDKLLEKFIDRDITVEQIRGDSVETFAGTLLSTSGGLVLRQADGSRAHGAAQRRREAAEPARRADHAAHAGVGRVRARRPASTWRAWPTRRAASPGGRTTTSPSPKGRTPTRASSTSARG